MSAINWQIKWKLKKLPKNWKKCLIHHNKRKENNIAPEKTNAQTSLERLKLTIQTYRMKDKELKMQFGQLQKEISKASLSVSADLVNDFKSIILETDHRKISPFMRKFWEE